MFSSKEFSLKTCQQLHLDYVITLCGVWSVFQSPVTHRNVTKPTGYSTKRLFFIEEFIITILKLLPLKTYLQPLSHTALKAKYPAFRIIQVIN